MFKPLRTHHGFMMLAIVLVLVGIAIVVLAIKAGSMIAESGQKVSRTQDILTLIDQRLVQYVTINQQLPCPSNPALNAATNGSAGWPLEIATIVNNSASDCGASRGGVVPWKALGLTLNEVTDEWGRLISYRVFDGQYGLTQAKGASALDCDTNNLATPNVAPTSSGLCDTRYGKHDTLRTSFVNYSGGIAFNKGLTVDDYGQNVPNVAYVLISHGPSGLDGYLPTGLRMAPPQAGALDYPNTQPTASAFNRLAPSPAGTVAGAAGHYDDIVRYLTISDLLKMAKLEARDWPEQPPPSFTAATTSNMTIPSNDPLNPRFITTGAAGSGREFTPITVAGQPAVASGAAAGSFSNCLWWPNTTTLVNDTQRFSLTAFVQFAATDNTGDPFPGFVMGFLSPADAAGAPTASTCGTSIAATTTATGATGQKIISVASVNAIAQGMSAFGDGIPFNATVSSISGLTVTLSQNLVGTLSSTSISFADGRRIRRDLGWAGGTLAAYTDRFGVEFDANSDTGSAGPPAVPTANDPSAPHLAVDYQGVEHGNDAASCASVNSGLGCNSHTTNFPFVSTSATGTSGQFTINVTTVAGIVHGMSVSGNGINNSGPGTTVTALSGNVVTLSAANTSTVSGTIDFASLSPSNFMQNSLNVFHNLRVELYPRDCVVTTATGGASGATTITVNSTSGIAPGMAAYGVGIGVGAVVVGVTATTVAFQTTNSANVSGTITFGESKAPSTTATGTTGQFNISVASTTGIAVGSAVSGTGIGSGAIVLSVVAPIVTLSTANSANVTGTVSFSSTHTRMLVKAWTLSNAGCNEIPSLCATLKDTSTKFSSPINTNDQVLYAVSCIPASTPASAYDAINLGITTSTRTSQPAVTTTVAGSLGQTTITVSNAAGIVPGLTARAAGIGNGATVVSVAGSTVTLSTPNLANIPASTAITFGGGANTIFQGLNVNTRLLP